MRAAVLAACLAHAVPAQETATVLVMLGENAKQVERWNGSVRVTGGRLISLEDRHFSRGDAITGPNSWKCVTRRDFVAPYASINYTEMRPGERPPELFFPVGLYLTVEGPSGARVNVETAQGNFAFALREIRREPKPFLGGRATVRRVPRAVLLTTETYEDDEPAIAALPDGRLAVAWVAYRERADRVLVRIRSAGGSWGDPLEATPEPGDIFRCSLAALPSGGFWIFWSQRDGTKWDVWGRRFSAGSWQRPVRLSASGSNTFHRAAWSPDGTVFVVWQSHRGRQSDIILRVFRSGRWEPELRVSESSANDWEPAVAAGPRGEAFVAWDTYDRGNYDVRFRAWRNGKLGPVRILTESPRFQAQVSVAVDPRGRPWVAWNESGVNWGKDQGFLILTPLAVPLHQQRWIRLAAWDGKRWHQPKRSFRDAAPARMKFNAEHPQIAFDSAGGLVMVFRHWTRQQSRRIGSRQVWENYVTRFDGRRWSTPAPLPHSGSWIEKHAALARDASGDVWAAWMSDNRRFADMVPRNAEVYAGLLGRAPGPVDPAGLEPFEEPFSEAIPVHLNEARDVAAIRNYVIEAGGKRYRICRGDMHRHTDISQDFKYDGSLIEVYRYALDAAAFDYIAPTDHQTGYDQEYSWWQSEKLVDLFHVPGAFVPLFAFERSIRFPNGHRNIVRARRGFRTFPIPPEEARGEVGAAKLYEYLRRTGAISMPHSSATAQGTDWRDNDPEVEPLIEIYQGYRNSYEYEGAPRAASTLNQRAAKSGWNPLGFWWNALAKGYKLGVQASSDHWSTHISYACIVAEDFSRDGLLAAMKKRHAYAATDNIVLDFTAQAGGREYLMGDAFEAPGPPRLNIAVIGTGPIKQIDIIRNRRFVYTARPGSREARFAFTDAEPEPGESWYYVRVLQEDGELAWSSPVWVTLR